MEIRADGIELEILPINDRPTLSQITDQNLQVNEDLDGYFDSIISITYEDLLQDWFPNAEDIDGDTIVFALSNFGENFNFLYNQDGSDEFIPVTSSIIIEPGGSIEWTPLSNINGDDLELFSVNASDGFVLSEDTADITVDVLPVNDPPDLQVISPNPTEISAEDSASVQIIADDIEGNSLSYDLIDGLGWASVNELGVVTINPSLVDDYIELGEGIKQDVDVRYIVSDDQQDNSTSQGVFTVTIEGVNDAPTIQLVNPLEGFEDVWNVSSYFDLLNFIQLSDPDLVDAGNPLVVLCRHPPIIKRIRQ